MICNFAETMRALELRHSLRLLVTKILLDFKSELGVLPLSAPNSRNQSKFSLLIRLRSSRRFMLLTSHCLRKFADHRSSFEL